MAPNAEGRKNYWKQESLEEALGSDSDSDSEFEFAVPTNNPNPQVWFHVGRGFQVLLDFVPRVYEEHFIAQLLGWLLGEEVDRPALPQFRHPEDELQLARDFYSRGLRYNGQFLTPDEVEAAMNDFFLFYTPERVWNSIGFPEPLLLEVRPQPQQELEGLPAVRWRTNEDNVDFLLQPEQEQQPQLQEEQQQQQQQQHQSRL